MAYATITDLGHFGIRPEGTEDKDTVALDEALEAASSEADTYLAKAYTLPLTTVSKALKMHVSAMAAYAIMATGGIAPTGTDEILRQRRQDALDWLKMLAAGEVTDPGIEDSTPDVTEGGAAVVTLPKRGW